MQKYIFPAKKAKRTMKKKKPANWRGQVRKKRDGSSYKPKAPKSGIDY